MSKKMIKCHIHVKNEYQYMDDDVFVEIMLPALPQVGNYLYLSKDLMEELESKARTTTEIASVYAPDWFYGKSCYVESPTERSLVDLSFRDAIKVVSISFNTGVDYVCIEIGD